MTRAFGAMMAALLVVVPGAAATETARGTVFHDLDRDGVRDRSEPGVAGVAVSNGVEVVESDGLGRWELPCPPGTTLFVTKPSGWAVPVDRDNLPQFFYTHSPGGSPEHLRYRGVDPTGPLPELIDFPLTRADEPQRFSVICLSDPQPQTEAELDFLRDSLGELMDTGAVFGITTGDIVYDDMSQLPRSNRLMGRIGVPWYNTPGNHEINYLALDDAGSLETFQRTFGPPYYSFDYARVHVVVLDTVRYLGSNVGRDEPDPLGAGRYEGWIDDDQLAWLAADLSRVPDDRLVLLAMHIPLVSALAPDEPSVNVGNRDRLLELLSGRSALLALAGHTHTAEHHYLGPDDGFAGPGRLHLHTLATASGSWWSGPLDAAGIPVSYQRDGTPRGWYLLEVDGVEATLSYRAFGRPADRQMRIELDSGFPRHLRGTRRDFRHGELHDLRVGRAQVCSTELVVNLFDGGPRSRVTVRIGDREPTVARRVVRLDPFVEELFQRATDSLKDWVRPVPSTHLWAAPLPRDLGPGAYRVEVRAVDEYGTEHVQHAVLEVAAGSAPLSR